MVTQAIRIHVEATGGLSKILEIVSEPRISYSYLSLDLVSFKVTGYLEFPAPTRIKKLSRQLGISATKVSDISDEFWSLVYLSATSHVFIKGKSRHRIFGPLLRLRTQQPVLQLEDSEPIVI